jgi:hypothetical protein
VTDNSAGLIDKCFFAVCILVNTVFALAPEAFFRVITLGRANLRNISRGLLRTVRLVAAITAVCFAIRLAVDLWRDW